jgi:hypothetical protein
MLMRLMLQDIPVRLGFCRKKAIFASLRFQLIVSAIEYSIEFKVKVDLLVLFLFQILPSRGGGGVFVAAVWMKF